MSKAALPPFLGDMLADCPKAGAGVHPWLFRVSRHLHAHLPAGDIIQLLETHTALCGRSVPKREIVAAVRDSIACAWQPGNKILLPRPGPKWPTPNIEQIEAIVRDGGGLADLWEESPMRIDDTLFGAEEIIDRIFPGNPLLCCAHSQSDFDTKPREDWRGQLHKLQFIVPNTMTALTGLTLNGQESKHALSNTGPRRFLVVECDFAVHARDGKTETPYAPLIRRLAKGGDVAETVSNMCAAVLLHLATKGPLALVVHSGGKSLHGWFAVQRQQPEMVERFFRYAVSLGADPATWTRSQFVRMPDGQRDCGKRQTVFFFNPLLLTSPNE